MHVAYSDFLCGSGFSREWNLPLFAAEAAPTYRYVAICNLSRAATVAGRLRYDKQHNFKPWRDNP